MRGTGKEGIDAERARALWARSGSPPRWGRQRASARLPQQGHLLLLDCEETGPSGPAHARRADADTYNEANEIDGGGPVAARTIWLD